MTGSGGWPMTVVATPDGRPFFAGTYFPKERRGGQIGFVELCERIGELWATRRAELLEQADQLTGALGRSALLEAPGEHLAPADVDSAIETLPGAADLQRRGLGRSHQRREERSEGQ